MGARLRCLVALALLAVLVGGCRGREAVTIDEPPPPVERAAPEQWGLVYDSGEYIACAPVMTDAKPLILLRHGDRHLIDTAISPDGRRLALVADDLSVHIVDLAGAADHRIVAPPEGLEDRRDGLAWAPDSERLAWLEGGEVHVTSADGADIMVDDSGQATAVAWSPDGAQLAVCRRDDRQIDQGLWIVPAEGGEPRQIVPGTGDIWAAAFPAWSPDGATIAFAHAWEGGALCFVGADGSGLRADLGPAFGRFVWLADSSGVIYAAAANEMETEGIAFCAPDGEPRLLLEGEFSTFDALPSGDVALISGEDGAALRLMVIEDATGAGTDVSTRDLSLPWARCDWRPDGEMLAVWCDDPESGAPLLAGGRTGELTRVVEGVDRFIGWGRR